MSSQTRWVRDGQNRVIAVTSGLSDGSTLVRDSQGKILGRTDERLQQTRRADNSLVSTNTADVGLLIPKK